MKKPVVYLCLVITLCCVSCKIGKKEVQPQIKEAKVFFVNLYQKNVDFILGESDFAVFDIDNLEPFSVSSLAGSNEYGSYKLHFKDTGTGDYFFWADKDGDPIYCDILPGKIHCFIYRADGSVDYYTLDDPTEPGAYLAFCNGSKRQLARMEVGKEYNTHTEAFVNDLDSGSMTNFASIIPGEYAMFWSVSGQEENSFYYYPDSSGEAARMWSLEDGGYYLFLTYDGKGENGMPLSFLYNITP